MQVNIIFQAISRIYQDCFNDNGETIMYINNTSETENEIVGIEYMEYLQTEMNPESNSICIRVCYRSVSSSVNSLNYMLKNLLGHHLTEKHDYTICIGDINMNLKIKMKMQ